MLRTIQIVILVLSLLDLTASYFYVNQFHKMFPKRDSSQVEANPILKYSIKSFGVKEGMIFGGILVFFIVVLLVLNITDKYLYYLAGVFTMMLVYHGLNFKLLLGGFH